MSARWLVDTDIISETSRTKPVASVVQWLRHVDIALSAVSVYELEQGVQSLPNGRRRDVLGTWLARVLATTEVVSFDHDAALIAARLERDARRRGRSVAAADLFVLASAKSRGLGVATHNVKHFEGLGVVVFDPFTGAYARP